MLFQVDSATVLGIDALIVQVEGDARSEEVKVLIVRLPYTTMRKVGKRVRTALPARGKTVADRIE